MLTPTRATGAHILVHAKVNRAFTGATHLRHRAANLACSFGVMLCGSFGAGLKWRAADGFAWTIIAQLLRPVAWLDSEILFSYYLKRSIYL
jgi:hypothetical protein